MHFGEQCLRHLVCRYYYTLQFTFRVSWLLKGDELRMLPQDSGYNLAR